MGPDSKGNIFFQLANSCADIYNISCNGYNLYLLEVITMSMPSNNLAEELHKRSIRVSEQRLIILEYLADNQYHPTADDIFNALHQDLPTLSKTTVYSTLKAFARENLLREINLDGHEHRYDINIGDHGHFRCDSCDRIYDFNISIDIIPSASLDGFLIKDKNVYFKGICPSCLLNINNSKREV